MAWREKQKVSPSNHFTVACWGQNLLKIAVPYAKIIEKNDLWKKRQAMLAANVSLEEGIQNKKGAFM